MDLIKELESISIKVLKIDTLIELVKIKYPLYSESNKEKRNEVFDFIQNRYKEYKGVVLFNGGYQSGNYHRFYTLGHIIKGFKEQETKEAIIKKFFRLH